MCFQEILLNCRGCIFVLAAQANEASGKNPFVYDESVSGGSVYNYFRDYDPSTGRHIESDPIGLDGGLNTYGYASANPLMFYDPYGLFGVDDIFGAIYDVTDGYSPSQGLVDGVAGFGDAFLISKLVRDAYDIGSVDQCSTAYGRGKVAGVVAGSIPFAARGAAWLGGTRFGHLLNHNRILRIGPGRWGKDMVARISSPYLPGDGHFSLLSRLPFLPPVGALSEADCECSK